MIDRPEWEAPPPTPAGPEPMGVGAILDVGLRVIRRRWAVLLAIAVVFIGPGALLTAATSFRFNQVAADIMGPEAALLDGSMILTEAEFDRLVGALVPALLAIFIAGLIGAVGVVAASAVVGADFFHRPMPFAVAVRVALRRALSALAFILVTTAIVLLLVIGGLLLMALSLLLVGGGELEGGPGVFLGFVIGVGLVVLLAFLTMRWAPALPAIANEDVGWREAMRRSGYLSGDNLWRIFAVWLAATLVTALLGALISQLLAIVLVDALAVTLGIDSVIAESVALALGTVLLAPLLPVLTAVLYFDLRVRRDPPGTLSG